MVARIELIDLPNCTVDKPLLEPCTHSRIRGVSDVKVQLLAKEVLLIHKNVFADVAIQCILHLARVEALKLTIEIFFQRDHLQEV